MTKGIFKRGFLQNSKNGKFHVRTIKLGTEKICLKESLTIKIEKPIKPLKELEVKKV
jgi:hypothetical protein